MTKLIFKGKTPEQARAEAHFAGLDCHAWSQRACICGVWTYVYEVAA